MSKAFSLFVFTLMTVSALSVWSDDVYWISYEGHRDVPFGPDPSGGRYLLQIDKNGNLLRGPVRVIPNSVVAGPKHGGTALGLLGPHRLTYWMPDKRHLLVGAVISKTNLEVISIEKSSASTFSTVQITDKTCTDCRDFIAAPTVLDGTRLAVGFDIARNGSLTGESRRLSSVEISDCLSFSCGVSVSADGRMAVIYFRNSLDPDPRSTLVLQQLNSNGDPKSSPINFSRTRLNRASVDITNPLAEGKRFLVYLETNAQLTKDTIYVQPVDARTGAKLGSRVRLRVATNRNQTVAIDPRGRFVLFVDRGLQLIYQGLDATGHAVGEPLLLARDVDSGINLLRDQN